MNYLYLGIILLTIIILISLVSCKCTEGFKTDFKRKPVSKNKIQLGMFKNTPEPLKKIIIELQKLGGQLSEDTRYDKVATNYLDPKNIK